MRKYIGLVAAIFCVLFSVAQTPVQVTPQLLPPYSLQASDYYSGMQPKLQVLLLNRDINQPTIQVRLKMTIESQNCRMQTKASAVLPSFTLTSGIPYYLAPHELQPLFNAANLDFGGGYSGQEYLQTGRLPEGLYTFTIEAYELYSGNLVSNKGFSIGWLTLADPPLLNTPAKAEAVTPANPQNIIFNWTPRHNTSPTAGYFTDYIFTLVEYNDINLGPEASFTSSPPLYIDSTNLTTYLYGPGQPQLIAGRRYAWRVQAKAKDGSQQIAMFRNNGFSEVFWFTYENNCTPPTGISHNVQGLRATIEWSNNPQHLEWKVEYREKNNPDAQWFTLGNTLPRVMLTDLKPGTQYEYRVGGSCMAGQFTYSVLSGFTTGGSPVPPVPNCGDSTLPAPGGGQMLQTLNVGDTIRAGSFTVHVGYTSGTGNFTGMGYVIVPWLMNAKVEVRFTNITLSLDRKLLGGVIETTYDPNESGIDDIDEYIDLFTAGYGVGGVVTGLLQTDTTVNMTIGPLTGTPPGIQVTLPPGFNPQTGPYPVTVTLNPQGGGAPQTVQVTQLPYTVQDQTGAVYQVGANGAVTQLAQPGGGALLQKVTKNKIDNDKGLVTFAEAPDGKYAFDAWRKEYKKSNTFNKEYERLGLVNSMGLQQADAQGSYYVAAKAIAPGETEPLLIKVQKAPGSTINPDSIKYITGKGSIYPATRVNDSTYKITILGGPAKDAQEIYAVYPQSGAKNLNLGKVLVASYAKREYKVKLVPVNGATINEVEAKKYLDSVYGKLNINFIVEKESNFSSTAWDITNSDGKLEVTGSGLFSVLTPEMKKLVEVYKTGRTLGNYIYLFVLSDASLANVEGDMPRGKQFGYLFTNGNSRLNRTVAHETGHGVFRLKHLFDGYGFTESDLPDNLLSYGNGNLLAKAQWDLCHDPAIVLSPFERDGDAMSLTITDMSELINKFKNSANSLSFLSPAGKRISILATELTEVRISTGDQWVDGASNEPANVFTAIGVLNGFKKRNSENPSQIISYDGFGSATNFEGYRYKNANGQYVVYSDNIYVPAANSSNANDGKVITGIPATDNKKFLLKLKAAPYAGTSGQGPVANNHTGKYIDYNTYVNGLPNFFDYLRDPASQNGGTPPNEANVPASSSFKNQIAKEYAFDNILLSNLNLFKNIQHWKNAELVDRYPEVCEGCILVSDLWQKVMAEVGDTEEQINQRLFFQANSDIPASGIAGIDESFKNKALKLKIWNGIFVNATSAIAACKSNGTLIQALKETPYDCVLEKIGFADRIDLLNQLSSLDELELTARVIRSTPNADQLLLLNKLQENDYALFKALALNYREKDGINDTEDNLFPAIYLMAQNKLTKPAVHSLPDVTSMAPGSVLYSRAFPLLYESYNTFLSDLYIQGGNITVTVGSYIDGTLNGRRVQLDPNWILKPFDFITVYPASDCADPSGSVTLAQGKAYMMPLLQASHLSSMMYRRGSSSVKLNNLLRTSFNVLALAAPLPAGNTAIGSIIRTIEIGGKVISLFDIGFTQYQSMIVTAMGQEGLELMEKWDSFREIYGYVQMGAMGVQLTQAGMVLVRNYVSAAANFFEDAAKSANLLTKLRQIYADKADAIFNNLKNNYYKLRDFLRGVNGIGSVFSHITEADFASLQSVTTVLRSGGARAINNVRNLVNEAKALIFKPADGTAIYGKVDEYVNAYTNGNSALQGQLGEEIAELVGKEINVTGDVLNVKINNSGHGFDVLSFTPNKTNPTVVKIFEAKPLSGTSVELPNTTSGGVQMGDSWTQNNINAMMSHADANIQQLGNVMNQLRLQNKIEKFVVTIDKDLKQVIVLKLDNF